jgi:hypothetical protein
MRTKPTMTARRALAACALAASALASSAMQAQAPERPRIGFLFGASFATISDADLAGTAGFTGGSAKAKRRIGGQFGIYLAHPLSSNVSLQPELHYIQKGTRAQAIITDIEGQESMRGEVAVRMSYYEVPLLLRVDMGGQRLRSFLVAGPSVATRVGCDVTLTRDGSTVGADCDLQIDGLPTTDPFKRYDIGGIIGFGIASRGAGRAMSVQVRYSRGLVSIARVPVAGYSPRNTGISVLFGGGF